MFDWQKRIQIYQAESALKDGRLDEAFEISSRADLQEWRGTQVVLEKLVEPLLDRAAEHLRDGRPRDALQDVERAQRAGGNRPRVAELRAEVVARLSADHDQLARHQDLLASARRHLAQGSVTAGKVLLENVPAADPEASRLRREAEHREARAREALSRSELLLKEGSILEALRAAGEARADFARIDGLAAHLIKLKSAALPLVDRSLEEGSLRAASEILPLLSSVVGEGLETRGAAEALGLCREARRRLDSLDAEGAEPLLQRLARLLPRAKWIGEMLAANRQVIDGLHSLRGGALHSLPAGAGAGRNEMPPPLPSIPPPLPSPFTARRDGAAPGPAFAPAGDGAVARSIPGRRNLLWIDGVGTFLVLRGDRISIGRSGSSSRPDLALAADIGGIQAEILRVDDDYFLAAHGAVEVNGRRAERKLLADGDRIRLAPRCELVFRFPTPLSPTAILELSGAQRLDGDVQRVVLLDRHLILGEGKGCHIPVRGAGGPIVLSAGEEGLTLRAEEGIVADGKPCGKECAIESGVRIQVGEATFTVGSCEGGRA